MTFFGPMKRVWRKILASWKETPEGAKSTVLQKQHFPLLLKQLVAALEPNGATNLIAGFRKCDIHPVNVDELLAMIPRAEGDKNAIERTFLQSLKSKRSELTGTKTSKRKKIAVAAGKSISPEILNNDPAQCNEEPQSSSKKRRKSRNAADSDLSADEISLRDSSGGEDFLENILREAAEDDETFAVASGQKTNKDLLSLQEVVKEIGEHVLFQYEGEIFPGKIITFDDNGATLSAMVKSLKNWKWPDKPDTLYYQWDDIIGRIRQPKKVCNRGHFSVPELDRLWSR